MAVSENSEPKVVTAPITGSNNPKEESAMTKPQLVLNDKTQIAIKAQAPAPKMLKPGQLREPKLRADLGLNCYRPVFPGIGNQEVVRPTVARPRISYMKAAVDDVVLDSYNPAHPETGRQIQLASWERTIDYCASGAIMEMAALHGKKEGNGIFVPHLVLEIGGNLQDNPWVAAVIEYGVIDPDGNRWMPIDDSAAAMRQGKLFLWSEKLSEQSLHVLAGDYLDLWLRQEMVPSKFVSYLGLAFSSLIYQISGDVFKPFQIDVVKDVKVKHPKVKAKRRGREKVEITHTETVTDGVIAVGSNVMRAIEEEMGFPEKTIHAIQIRGGIGTAIKGLMVEYPEINPDRVMVFESATKLTKDTATVREMLTSHKLGICRINRMPDNLTGLTALSKQVMGLLLRDTIDAKDKAMEVAEWASKNIVKPEVVKILLSITDADKGGEEEVLAEAAMNAAKDGDIKKAAILQNPALALQDRTIRRYVADLLVEKIRRQGSFGNLLVNGFDLWQAPEPLVIAAVDQGLIDGDELSVTRLKDLGKKLDMKVLKADEVQWAGCPEDFKGKRVALVRHPLQHPCQLDISRVVKSTDDHRWGLVFLPAAGIKQATMGGSDFDGDEIKLVADEEIIDAVIEAKGDMEYIILPPDAEPKKVKVTHENYQEVLKGVLLRAMRAVGQIGIISNLASTASALTQDDAKRELLLSVLSYLVMEAVDAVKTSQFPDPTEHLSDEDLDGTPLRLKDGKLIVRSKKINDDTYMPIKAVWLGQAEEFRAEMARKDRTVMADLFMAQDELARKVSDGAKDSNDKRVATQLMKVARSLVEDVEALSPLADRLVDLLPEDEREASMDKLKTLRAARHASMWKLDRAGVQHFNKAIAQEKKVLAAIMTRPAAEARAIMEQISEETARALAAAVYHKRPAAAWAFCGPELADVFGRVLDKAPLLVKLPAKGGSIEVMGIEFNEIEKGVKLTPQKAEQLARQLGAVVLRPVEYQEKGMVVHRAYIGEICIGQVSDAYEPYAETISGVQMQVDIHKTFVQGRTLTIKLMPPVVENGVESWLKSSVAKIEQIFNNDNLDTLVDSLRAQYRTFNVTDNEAGLKLGAAITAQREVIRWASLIDGAQTVAALYEAGRRIGKSSVDSAVKAALRSRFESRKFDLTSEIPV